MSATKHTPGPWIQDEGNPLCIGTPKPWYPRQVYRIVATLEGGKEYTANHNATAEANARLIADAPALLDALAEVIRYDDLTQPCDHAPDPESCTHCRARELVAKHKEMRNA